MFQIKAKTGAVDMTSGSIIRLLISFAVPLLLGNLFQQLYNTVDILVVGNFVGTQALAAVGSTTNIINTIIMFFNGVSIGAGVIISRYYGAHDDEKLHLAVETTLALTFISGVLCTALGVYLSPFLLRFMATPDDVLPEASVYLRIYFSGVSGLLIYNMCSAILRAVGDTRRPLMFLVFSSFLNIGLDLLFVISFRLGIAGVAYATILSQFISALLVLLILTRTRENYVFVWKDICINKIMLKQILIVGFPTGLQQSITSFSNVYVQSYINSFGSSCMAGWSCYTKIDQFIFLPLQSMSQAATTFVSQNIGAKNVKRAKQGSNTALALSASIIFCSACVIWLFAPVMVSLFNKDPEVLYYGTLFLRLCVFFTLTACVTQVYAGTLRGIGDAKTPMVIMLLSYVIFRQIYLYLITKVINTPYTVALGYPAGWIVCSLLTWLYYKFSGWEKKIH
ncbi:MATE family efflux transporter [Lachnospiraceae bacterium 45-P1]